MEDFYPEYLRQNIRSVKLAEDKSKGQIVCSYGCEEFDYNSLFFKYIPSEEMKKMAEIQKRGSEMQKKHIGPYKNFVLDDIRFLAVCTGERSTVKAIGFIMWVNR